MIVQSRASRFELELAITRFPFHDEENQIYRGASSSAIKSRNPFRIAKVVLREVPRKPIESRRSIC